MSYVTAEEALQRDVATLGLAYGTAFHHCCQELWRVSSNWDRYEALFGSQERVDILNSSDGAFWYAMQSILHEHVLLGICRLTDPAGSGSRQNLSVKRLLELDPTDTKSGLAARVQSAAIATRFARTWRDKRISHNDLQHISGDASLLESSTGRKVSDAIVAIHDVLRWIMARYFDGDMFLHDLGDDDSTAVLIALSRGRSVAEEEQADLAAGRFERHLNKRYAYPRDDYGRSRRYLAAPNVIQPERYTGPLPLQT